MVVRDSDTDYYKFLGVNRNATAVEINRRYRELAKRHGPDYYHAMKLEFKESDNERLKKMIDDALTQSVEYMKELNSIYEVLSNPVKKRQYDAWLKKQDIIISVSTNRLDFGKIEEGKVKELAFTVYSHREEDDEINVDFCWVPAPNWGELLLPKDVRFPWK
jgi:curved DNA-binding protein CbpA